MNVLSDPGVQQVDANLKANLNAEGKIGDEDFDKVDKWITRLWIKWVQLRLKRVRRDVNQPARSSTPTTSLSSQLNRRRSNTHCQLMPSKRVNPLPRSLLLLRVRNWLRHTQSSSPVLLSSSASAIRSSTQSVHPVLLSPPSASAICPSTGLYSRPDERNQSPRTLDLPIDITCLVRSRHRHSN
jgi:hypothetical protein